jgi:histidine ammonia-lyase
MTAPELVLDGGPLEIAEVISVARGDVRVSLASEAVEKMTAARQVVDAKVAAGETVYGVTTGFGALADVRIPEQDVERMQLALLRSHSAGVGSPLDEEIVRAMLLLRARTLSQGYSGVRPVIAERLVDFINLRCHPVVPEQGSVGASGDLAQLAHLSLPLIGEGQAVYEGKALSGSEALKLAGLEPISLSYKEGLSLLNGTEAMLAVGCLVQADAERVARTADVICAMSVEALLGTDRAYDERLHTVRPHPGQGVSAENLLKLLKGSEIVASHRDSPHAVQDAYSLRCAPQVHGAVRDVLSYSRLVFERELASVTDNPIVFSSSGDVMSGGNFHGEPLGFALDFLAAAVAELGSISERRTDRLLDPHHSSGLPPFLTEDAGINSGFMLVQYTQAALVAENRLLASPATVDTIPTSGTQEDHVSMGWNAALKARRLVRNAARVLAGEAICAAQGIDLRSPTRPAAGTGAAHESMRSLVPHLDEDRALGPEMEQVVDELILSGVLEDVASEKVGGLK